MTNEQNIINNFKEHLDKINLELKDKSCVICGVVNGFRDGYLGTLIKLDAGPHCRPCLDVEKNCPTCEKPSTIKDLNCWDGQCYDCDRKENHADDDGPCERCESGYLWFCEEDVEYGDHKLFVSNVDGKNICRHCIAIEDAGEDWECPYECGLCEEKKEIKLDNEDAEDKADEE
jgi:hypothetical protein